MAARPTVADPALRAFTSALAHAVRDRVWAIAALALFVFPRQAALWNEIAILALFAVSLDLILGYGGIVSLGHAAFFGTGCYVAALFAKHVLPDPLVGLVVGTRRRGGRWALPPARSCCAAPTSRASW